MHGACSFVEFKVSHREEALQRLQVQQKDFVEEVRLLQNKVRSFLRMKSFWRKDNIFASTTVTMTATLIFCYTGPGVHVIEYTL